jgi:hypothetical protein
VSFRSQSNNLVVVSFATASPQDRLNAQRLAACPPLRRCRCNARPTGLFAPVLVPVDRPPPPGWSDGA